MRLVQAAYVHPIEPVPTAGRDVQAADYVHQGRLARARRPHNGDELAGLHEERHAAQGVHLDVAHAVHPGDVAKGYD